MIGCHVSAKDIHGMSKPLADLSRKVVGHDIGPKLVPMLKIVDALIKMKLTKPVIVPLINLSTKTLVAGGTVEKLLGQDVKRALRGPTFRHRQQVTLYCVLTQVANPCLACKLTRTLTLAFNGLLSKIKLLKPVMKLVNKLILMVPGLLKSLKVVTKLVKKLLVSLLGPKTKDHRKLDEICKQVNATAKKGLKGFLGGALGLLG